MRDFIFQAALLAAMLTIGKVSSDTGYWVNLAVIIIGAIIGTLVFALADRHARKRKAE